MAYADRMIGSRRVARSMAVGAGVALVHGALGYLLVTGMMVEVVRGVTRTLTTTNVPLPKVPPPDPVPLPKPKPLQNEHSGATSHTVITFDRTIAIPAANNRVTVDDPPFVPQPLDLSGEPEAQPPSMPSKARGPGVRGNRAAWITNADYPGSALLSGQQGRVGIAVQIGVDGRVTQCSVTEPSGSPALDAVTCRLYRSRARFDPARDDAGSPIASRYTDRVRWQLPE